MTDSHLVASHGFHGVLTPNSLVLWLDDANDQIVVQRGDLAWGVHHRELSGAASGGPWPGNLLIAGPFASRCEAFGEALGLLHRQAEYRANATPRP